MKHFKIRNGLAVPSAHKRQSSQIEDCPVSEIALLGSDFLKLRPSIKVKVGDKVEVGQTLLTDRHDADIAFVSPTSGTVKTIERGAHRSLSRLVISKAGKGAGDPVLKLAVPSVDQNSVREAMLASGLWLSFVARPFGLTPRPSSTPTAIFVNAVQRTADAPDPAEIVRDAQDAFELGLDRLTMLCPGPVFLCQNAPQPLVADAPSRVEFARFTGTYAAGLSGTHIHRLALQSAKEVWTINYQDVIALGQLAGTGEVPQTRIVAITGNQAEQRSLCRVPLGSNLRSLTTGKFAQQAQAQNIVVLSGDTITGNPSTHLGRFDYLVSIETSRAIKGIGSSRDKLQPIIPVSALMDALPFGMPTLPIMRALSIADFERATSLNCGTMIEEDVASLNMLCASNSDYRPLLRRYLDHLEEAVE